MLALDADFPLDQLVDFLVAAKRLRRQTGLRAALVFHEIELGGVVVAAETIEVTDPRRPELARWWVNAAECGLVAATQMSTGTPYAAASISDALALVGAGETSEPA